MRRFVGASLAIVVTLGALPPSAQAQAKRGDRNTITRVDIDEAGAAVANAYDAVQRLRPNWLRGGAMGRMTVSGVDGRSGETANEPVLYIDERRQPSLDQLRTVQAASIFDLKFMDQNRAIQMLGPGHELGAILVTTRKP
jgi:hypothetical protein